MTVPDKRGYYGDFGGKFVPETLVAVLRELEEKYRSFKKDREQQEKISELLNRFAGRPTPLYYAENLSRKYKGAKLYLKREDLLHTGAHKINNTIGQILLAEYMGKNRIIAETGAGQHGVATATVSAMFGKKCVVYMGEEDMRRQSMNVFKMKLLRSEVRAVSSGSRTLKDATSEAIRDWVTNAGNSYYLIGSTVGPHPYPMIVRDFQKVIGKEVRRQLKSTEIIDLSHIIACVGGGSNAIGIFNEFVNDKTVNLIGVEAAGLGLNSGSHAAPLAKGKPGVLHGALSYLLQDKNGQVIEAHSVSAGLDYPGVGPEHSYFKDTERVSYKTVTDKEALSAFQKLTEYEGIMPALESSHAVAYALKLMPKLSSDESIIVNLSGRGDKDLTIIEEKLT
ncbi:MAG: tryptophan synthase subunit beta [bacterium]|nr:tryptophan synthase subunit beta [bacterium]